MGLRINNNVASIAAQVSLGRTTRNLAQNLERLSSGLRITRAGDDAAGLAISEALRADIRGFKQAVRNANDAISLVQVAEGSLSEINNILSRLRELALQSSTATVGSTERTFLDDEFQALVDEITRITDITEFNGQKLLNGALSGENGEFQVGIQDATTNRLSIAVADQDSTALGINADDLLTASAAQAALATLDAAITSISDVRGQFGTVQNRLSSVLNTLESSILNLTAAESRIRDVDFASETADYTRNQILQQSGTSILAQANVSPQAALRLLQ